MIPTRKLPKPYFDNGQGIVIYCGDNRAILPMLPVFDLCLTDPPYGIGEDGGGLAALAEVQKQMARNLDGTMRRHLKKCLT